jgi:hypothetical protein
MKIMHKKSGRWQVDDVGYQSSDNPQLFNCLSLSEKELYEERAGILEFMEGVNKEVAEKIALERILIRRKIWN